MLWDAAGQGMVFVIALLFMKMFAHAAVISSFRRIHSAITCGFMYMLILAADQILLFFNGSKAALAMLVAKSLHHPADENAV